MDGGFDAYKSENRDFYGPFASVVGSEGNDTGLSVMVDWGAKAAFLFGRQRARVHHDTEGYKFKGFTRKPNTAPDIRARRPTGTARGSSRFRMSAVSGDFPSAMLMRKSISAIAPDFFFGAMDGGIDVRKSENVGIYGPFASISIGIGG